MLDYSIEIINDQTKLTRLIDSLASATVMAVDIETINWWNRHQERISLIQIAFKTERKSKVAVIDVLADLGIELLRPPLELNTTIKVVHNAAFDATRLSNHYQFKVAPVYDTMLAARRNGERRYSLIAQAQAHLNPRLDKRMQTSDWSRRPLDIKQIHYAAQDAFSTLMLYENQIKRNLNGYFQLKDKTPSQQASLPLIDLTEIQIPSTLDQESKRKEEKATPQKTTLSESSLALLGVIAELPSRYYPEQLAVSVGSEQRVGIAGWIVDKTLGRDADLDEETAKLEIADLLERDLVKITSMRRLEATAEGENLWHQLKTT
ncbi:MAG TPA: hypothetical protein VGB02_10345 [Pyrinomonadaceae bacterium]|jgi:ribonuclease D